MMLINATNLDRKSGGNPSNAFCPRLKAIERRDPQTSGSTLQNGILDYVSFRIEFRLEIGAACLSLD